MATKTARKFEFDIKTEATRGFHAYVGAADLALETVKDGWAEAQKRFEAAQKAAQERAQKRLAEVQKSLTELDLQPKALREQATTVVTARVEDAKAIPARVQTLVDDNVEQATETYGELVKRGETVVRRFRSQPAAKATRANAKTTVSKAKTTATQAKKAAGTAQGPKAPAKKKVTTAKRSAKATVTAAKKTATSAAQTVG